MPDNLQHLKIVVKLVEPLVNLGYALWMDSHYISTYVCSLLRDDQVSVAGTLHLNRKHVLQLVKSKKLTKGESVTAECNRFMVVKWRDKIRAIHILVPRRYIADAKNKGYRCLKTIMY